MRYNYSLLQIVVLWGLSLAQEVVWSDEFDTFDTQVWSIELGGGAFGNKELQYYTEDNVQVEDGGYLMISVREEVNIFGGGVNITSGRIKSSLEFTYGTVEASIKIPNPENGLWPAFWMIGANFDEVGWPECGTLSIMQVGSGAALNDSKAMSRVGSAAYWQANGETMYAGNEVDTSLDITDGFHSYTMEWTPDAITTFVDGIELFSIDISDGLKDEFHKPFNFVINVAAGGLYTGIDEKDEFTATLPAELVVDYIRIYDNGFTTVTYTPAATWTGEPTATPSPTATPMELPTSDPTREWTTDSSTDTPTFMPTRDSTEMPTTPLLSNEPSSSETTVPPSYEPTSAPSLSPTATPTARSLQVLEASTATMTLSGLDPLDSTLVKKWQQVTENHLQVAIIQTLGARLGGSCNVNVTLISQASRRVLSDNALRSLQTETIELSFNSIISLQSDVTENDANGLIRDSFISTQQKATYVDSLKESDAYFENVALESVTTGPSISRGVQAPQNDNTGPSIGFIAGMAAAGAAIFALNSFFLMKWRQKKRTSQRSSQPLSEQSERAKSPSDRGPLPLEDDDSFYVIARRDSSDRLSPHSDEGESEYASTPSSITIDSNYPSLFDFRSIHSDDTSTRVTEFEVIVPAGPLGIVLETSCKGVPVVRQIKSSSPLEEEIQVGDRLIIVNGMDVTMLGAAGVSRLIRAEKDKPMRKFVFARPEGIKMSQSDLG